MKQPQRIPYEDLLRVPYAEDGDDPRIGLDCWGQCCELLRRCGKVPPDVDRIVADMDTADSALTLVRKELRGPLELGDVLVSMPTHRPHVQTVVDPGMRLALTVQAGAGAILRPARMIENFVGVYRAREAFRG